MLTIAEREETGLSVELVNLIILTGLGDICGGIPQLITNVDLNGARNDSIALDAVLIRTRNQCIAAAELLARLTGRERLCLVPISTNHRILLAVKGCDTAVNVALKRTAGNVGHPVLLRRCSIGAALVILVTNLEIANSERLRMAELRTSIGPGNPAIGIGAPLGVQELNHVGRIGCVAAADAVNHDDLGVHLFGELGDLEQAESRHKARLTGIVVEAMNLRSALDLGRLGIKVTDGLGPHIVVRDRATRVAQRAETRLFVQGGKILLDGAVGIHRTVAIVRITMIDAK